MVGARHHRAAAGLRHGRRRSRVGIGRDHDRADRRPPARARSTCTIIGCAADVGERLARQAGRGHAGRDQDQDVGIHGTIAGSATAFSRRAKLRSQTRLYGLPARRQTGYLSGRPGAAPAPIHSEIPAFGSRAAMDSFELNKILGALLVTCLCLLSLNIAAGAVFAPHKPAKPGYEIAVQETAPTGGRRRAGRSRTSRSRSCSPAPTSTRARRRPRSAPPATPSARASRTASARTSTASSAAPKASHAGLQLFGGDEGQGRQLDGRGPRTRSCRTRRASCPAPS